MGHVIDFINVEILGIEPKQFSRSTLEILFIKTHNCLNTQVESNVFTNLYDSLLKILYRKG